MAFSKVDIVNMALAHLGEPSITAFADNNRRARLATTLFTPTMLAVLADVDWTFARRFKQLQESADSAAVPSTDLANVYTFDLPSDCLVPRELYPRGSQDQWEVYGRFLQCFKNYDDGVYLYYTTSEVTSDQYTHMFSIALAAKLASMFAPSLTQDKALTRQMVDHYLMVKGDAWHSDANIGNSYREYDNDKDNDSFVNVG